MKRFVCIVAIVFVLFFAGSDPASAISRESGISKDIPADACLVMGRYDPKAAAWTSSAYDKLLKSSYFLSVREAGSLDDADECDVAVRISQPDTWSVRAEIFSAATKERIAAVEEKGFFISSPADKVVSGVFAALGEGTALRARLLEERKLRLAGLKTQKEEAAKASAPDKQPVAAPPSGVVSDVDELPAARAVVNKNAYAIVIGIERYRQKLPIADFALRDARLVGDYLTRVMGYPGEHIVVLTDEHAAKSDFEKYFEQWLANHVEKGATVFVYYSGHGAPNPKTGDAFLVPYDGDPAFIDQTGYPLRRMYAALGKLPAKEIIVVLDACFSGAGERSVLAGGARPLVLQLDKSVRVPGNVTVLAASSGSQISSTYKEKGHGLFTYFLLKGIRNEDVVRPDGSLAVQDLYGYLKPQVERIARRQFNNEQTPQLIAPGKP